MKNDGSLIYTFNLNTLDIVNIEDNTGKSLIKEPIKYKDPDLRGLIDAPCVIKFGGKTYNI